MSENSRKVSLMTYLVERREQRQAKMVAKRELQREICQQLLARGGEVVLHGNLLSLKPQLEIAIDCSNNLFRQAVGDLWRRGKLRVSVLENDFDKELSRRKRRIEVALLWV